MPLAGSIAPFVVSSPFRGLRVVPCKLYFAIFQTRPNSNNIVSVTFKNQSFKYEYDSDTGAVKGIVGYPIAQYIGADPAKDMVVAYLEPTAEEDGKYDMTIAGPGGVTASWTLQNLSVGMANLRSVRFNGCLDTSAVTNMVGMF